MNKTASQPPLQACRTCEHGRNIIRADEYRGICGASHAPRYVYPEHEHDDQHGYFRHCADHVQRAEIIDADKEGA